VLIFGMSLAEFIDVFMKVVYDTRIVNKRHVDRMLHAAVVFFINNPLSKAVILY